MTLLETLLRTKVTPPALHRRLLPRSTLNARLREALDYRLTIVQAGTGYGKSTALAALAESDPTLRLAWCGLDPSDVDPQRFLSYLIAAFHTQIPNLSEAPRAMLRELSSAGSAGSGVLVIDALINALSDVATAPMLLVVDDYDCVSGSPDANALAERFVTYLPSHVHVIISARHPVAFSPLVAWRAKGQVLEMGREALAFRPDEIDRLFREVYGAPLSVDEVAALADKTEGWPIALHMVWHGLRTGVAGRVSDLLARGPASLGALFDYLARDVLDRQPPEVAAFLRDTAVLRELTPAACDAVTGSGDAASMLAHLHERDLFIIALGPQHFRYHHVFHDFLREQARADAPGVRDRHRRAAHHFRTIGDAEEAMYHWLAAQDFAEASRDVEAAGEKALQAGRLDTVAAWIDALPAETLADHPLLQRYLGDMYRLRSRFDEALAWYQAAERTWRARGDTAGISRALRGQALVYLDTVRPAQAESLLEEALRLTDGLPNREARARLVELLAENKLNMGKPDEAEALRAEARTLREEGPHEDVLGVRVKLRTGRLDEAQRILEEWAESERGQVHPPRMHRETVLILSLIHSLRGEADYAFARAQEGIALGERFGSPFVTAVGYMRLGHAHQLHPPPQAGEARGGSAREEAIRCYQQAIALGDRLAVRRTRAEAMWGLARAYGFFGDVASAESAAKEGIEIGQAAGDPWIVALIELTLGASYVLADRAADGVEALARALSLFRECGDRFGRAASRLWLSLAFLDLRRFEHFAPCVEDLLALCETNHYGFLFAAPTLLGPPDPRRLVPLLIEARQRGCRPAYAAQRLSNIGLPDIQVHPGYQLRVQTLGAFRVWRGAHEVGPREWQRDKARQLFQLLLTQKGRWLQRDAIVDRLWPTLSPEAATRDFKVALNALNRAIEPERAADAPFAFVVREGTAYRLRPEADVWIDSTAFEQACEAGLRLIASGATEDGVRQLQDALRLYHGDYLPEALYEDWASEERERLLSWYLRAANTLAGALIELGRFDESLEVCQSILARDACWERAYRLMMAAHARQGNRPQVLRVYQRCVSTLRDELGVEPSPATVSLYQRIAQGDPAVTGL